jgi:hypothetical protein
MFLDFKFIVCLLFQIGMSYMSGKGGGLIVC